MSLGCWDRVLSLAQCIRVGHETYQKHNPPYPSSYAELLTERTQDPRELASRFITYFTRPEDGLEPSQLQARTNFLQLWERHKFDEKLSGTVVWQMTLFLDGFLFGGLLMTPTQDNKWRAPVRSFVRI